MASELASMEAVCCDKRRGLTLADCQLCITPATQLHYSPWFNMNNKIFQNRHNITASRERRAVTAHIKAQAS